MVRARPLRGREPGPYLRYTVTADEGGRGHLTYEWEDRGLQEMVDLYFGKTLLFTDQPKWTDEEIIAAYRRQAEIEDAFTHVEGPAGGSLQRTGAASTHRAGFSDSVSNGTWRARMAVAAGSATCTSHE